SDLGCAAAALRAADGLRTRPTFESSLRRHVRRIGRSRVDHRAVRRYPPAAADRPHAHPPVIDVAEPHRGEDVAELRELAAGEILDDARGDLRLGCEPEDLDGHRIAGDLGQAEVRSERGRLLELHDLQGALAGADGIRRGDAWDELAERAAAAVAAEGAGGDDQRRVVV